MSGAGLWRVAGPGVVAGAPGCGAPSRGRARCGLCPPVGRTRIAADGGHPIALAADTAADATLLAARRRGIRFQPRDDRDDTPRDARGGRGGHRPPQDDGRPRRRHARRAHDRDRGDRRSAGRRGARARGDGRGRPGRPDLAAVQARLLRAQSRASDRARHRRAHGRRRRDVLPHRGPVHGRVARADARGRARGEGRGRVDAARRRVQAPHLAVRVQGARSGGARDPVARRARRPGSRS